VSAGRQRTSSRRSPNIRRARWPLTAAALAITLSFVPPLGAQGTISHPWLQVFAADELERYLRALQLVGVVPDHQWSVRAFSPRELARELRPRDARHPWSTILDAPPPGDGLRSGMLRSELDAAFNSTIPYGVNDGALWAGRGLSASIAGGGWARWGPLTAVLAPIATWSRNAPFALEPNGLADSLRYANALEGFYVDAPQRFGSGTVARLEAGQSTLRLDVGPVAAGISAASQSWGPAVANALVLGTEGPGFPHLFVGTSAPQGIGIGRVHGQVQIGSLAQSAYSAMPADSGRRLMAGVVGVFEPRGLSGLELGAGRFFHRFWDPGGWRATDFLIPFEGLLKVRLPEKDRLMRGAGADNQLLSFFFRWQPPVAGVEVYGELARSDHNADLRDALLEPDQNSAWMVGFQRAVGGGEGRTIRVWRAEVANARTTHVSRVREQARLAIHSVLRQGHTVEGQPLASPVGMGGAAAVVGWDSYTPTGRQSIEWRVTTIPRRRGEGEPLDGWRATHALGYDRLWLHGGSAFTLGAALVLDVNRLPGEDVGNLNLRASVRR
jgi:hypothetical protein